MQHRPPHHDAEQSSELARLVERGGPRQFDAALVLVLHDAPGGLADLISDLELPVPPPLEVAQVPHRTDPQAHSAAVADHHGARRSDQALEDFAAKIRLEEGGHEVLLGSWVGSLLYTPPSDVRAVKIFCDSTSLRAVC